MRKDKEKAFEMRRYGNSYKTISRELKIPMSTLSGWFKDEDWSQEIRDVLAENVSFKYKENLEKIKIANKKRWELIRQSYRDQAKAEYSALKNNRQFIACMMLYWGEGDKIQKNVRVRLANSDPEMINIFNNFLRSVLKIPTVKIKIWLLLYPDLSESVMVNFWSKATGIEKEQFSKSIFIKGKHPTHRLSYGVGNIEVYSRELKEKFMTWIDILKRDLFIDLQN